MKYALLLMCLGLSVSCSDFTRPSLESLRCPAAPAISTPNIQISGTDSSIFGSKTKDNEFNCIANPSICASLGVSFSCDKTQGCCVEVALGRCNKSTDCIGNDKPVCDLTNNICVSCSSTNMQLGDQQCGAWSVAQVDPLNRGLCISGLCAECRNNNDCTRPGKSFCDQTDNICKGCTSNSQCINSNICKLNESFLATGDTLSRIGECVPMSGVVLADNNPAVCDNAGAGGKPFCQVNQAVSSGKSYVKVIGHGAIAANLYQSVTISSSGQRVTIIGPGRDVTPYSSAQAVINGVTVSGGAQVNLTDISVTNNSGAPAVQCSGTGTLYVQNVLISDTIVSPQGGIYASNCSKVDVEKTKISGVRGYGVFISGGSSHRVINNAIINGGSAGEPAGMRLSGSAAGLFAFNTIANNRQGGVLCDNAVAVTDSIVMSNGAGPELSNCQQIRIVTAGVTLDPNYMNVPPADPKLISDPGNICIDKAMPDSNKTIKEDYYGAPRPQGNGYDIGFQEVR